MARVLSIDDHPFYAEMLALMLQKKGGHEVRSMIVPFELQQLRDFDPDVILLNLVRKTEALGAPIHDFDAQVEGAHALRVFQQDGALRDYPIVLTAMALTEDELPAGLDYVAFLQVPDQLDLLIQVIDQIKGSHGKDVAPR